MRQKQNKFSRRDFLKTSAVAGAPLVLPLSVVFGDDEKAAPSERVTVAH
ncbi:MAG: twin-arginine translocation signal domain-containing protein, partial [Planctomycetaceae bacterium]|nr:twin-arginine translocation signal domain-containing protein [Planctomycetaceae bacterium]